MNKQRMSNILSSIQMSPRDRKYFIDELSKLGQGGTGGEEDNLPFFNLVFNEVTVTSGTPPYHSTYQAYVLDDSELKNHELFKELNKEVKFKAKIDINTKNNQTYHISDYIICTGAKKSVYGNANTNYLYLELNTEPKIINYHVGEQSVSSQYYLASIELNVIDYPNMFNRSPRLWLNKVFSSNADTKPYEIEFWLEGANLNLTTLSKISTNKNYVCQLIRYITSTNLEHMIGNYYNGTITIFERNKLKQYNVNLETGGITESLSIDVSTLAGLEARIAALEAAQNPEEPTE